VKNKKTKKWQTPELTGIIGTKTGSDCSYGNGANPGDCYTGRLPQSTTCHVGEDAGTSCFYGNDALNSCSTGNNVV